VLLADPLAFDGKTVRFQAATVIADFDRFVIEGMDARRPTRSGSPIRKGRRGRLAEPASAHEPLPHPSRAAVGLRRRVTRLRRVRRSADAFGAPGESNGVLVGFGVANEVAPDEQQKGEQTSPDGTSIA
jgi:hypothetical protein